jgi:hypothetical protein
MALPTTGAISLSQVVAEFGGVAPHAMSEFYALLGKGVTGLPSSGVFNCSQFYGKSNQVITSVWTASGYNTSSSAWVIIGNSSWSRYTTNNSGSWDVWYIYGVYVYGPYWALVAGHKRALSYNGASYRRVAADYAGNNNYPPSYDSRVEWYQTTSVWTDTSAYVNTTTTAQITT